MRLTLDWRKTTDIHGNTCWWSPSPLACDHWRLNPVLQNDIVKWQEAHDKKLWDFWGTQTVYETLVEAMQDIEQKHERLLQEGDIGKLRRFAESMLKSKHSKQAREALGLLPKEGE